MAPRELFRPSVAVVHDEEKSRRHHPGKLRHQGLGSERYLNSLARLRMNAVAVEKIEFFG